MPFQESPNSEPVKQESLSQAKAPKSNPEQITESAISQIDQINDPFQAIPELFPNEIDPSLLTELEMLAPTLEEERPQIIPNINTEVQEGITPKSIQTVEIQDRFSLDEFNEQAQTNITEYLARFKNTPFQTFTNGNIKVRNSEGITISRLEINTPVTISSHLISIKDSEGTQITYGEILKNNQPSGEFVPIGFLNDSMATLDSTTTWVLTTYHPEINMPEEQIFEIAEKITEENMDTHIGFLELLRSTPLTTESLLSLKSTIPILAFISILHNRNNLPDTFYQNLITENSNNTEVLIAILNIPQLPESVIIQIIQLNNDRLNQELTNRDLSATCLQYLLTSPNKLRVTDILRNNSIINGIISNDEFAQLLQSLYTHPINTLIDVFNSHIDSPDRQLIIAQAITNHPERLLLSRTEDGLLRILETGARNTTIFEIPFDETLGRIREVPTDTVLSLMPENSSELEVNDMRIAITRNLHFKDSKPTTENITLAYKEILANQEAIRDLALYKDRTVIYLADSELTNTGEHRFGKQDAIQGVQNQNPTSLTFHRVENRENNQEAEELKQAFLNNLINSAFPLTLLYDGHGSPSTLININSEIGISSNEFAQALLARYQRPEFQTSTSPDIIILTSCYSANLIQTVLSTLAKNNIAPLPIMTSESEYGQIAYDNQSAYGTLYMQNALGLEVSNTNGQIATMGNILDFNSSEYDKSNPIIYLPSSNNQSHYQQIATNEISPQDNQVA